MAKLPTELVVAQPIPEGYGMAPRYTAVDYGRKGSSFKLSEGTPNILMDERIRRAISNQAMRLGFSNFKSLHVSHGYTLRSNSGADFAPPLPAHLAGKLGERYRVRAESRGVLLITMAEWYTPADIEEAFYMSAYDIEYGRIVKGDMCTVVNGVRIGRANDHSTEETLSFVILEMEELLARRNVHVSVDLQYVRPGKGDIDIYQMTVRGQWQGGSRIKPDFMGA